MGGTRAELRSHNHSGGSSSPSELIIEEMDNADSNRECGSTGDMSLPMHGNINNGGMLPHYAMIHQSYHHHHLQQPQDLSHLSAYENGNGHHPPPNPIVRSPFASSNLHYSNNNNNINQVNNNHTINNPLGLPEGCHAVVKYETPPLPSESPVLVETHIKNAKIDQDQVINHLFYLVHSFL